MARTGTASGRRRRIAGEPARMPVGRTVAGLPEAVQLLLGLAAQTAVLTGLLYYFGWARAASAFGYFGIDLSLVHLSTSDYLLRSVGAAVPPIVLGIGALALVLPGGRLARRLVAPRSSGVRVPVAAAVHGAALLLVAAGLWASFRPIPVDVALPARPLLVSVGLLLMLAGWPLFEAAVGRPVAVPVSSLILLGAAGVGFVLWSWSLYAGQLGVDRAEEMVADLPYRESISVYSTQRLAIAGPGVAAISLEGVKSRYVVRYDGLRLLIRTGDGTLFLVPEGWRRHRDPVFQVKDDGSVRVDVVSAAG